MFTLLRQENRKLMHHRVIQLFIPFIMIFQFIIAIYAAHYPQLLTPYDAFVNNDYGFIPILFLAITIGSTYLTNERQNGTLFADPSLSQQMAHDTRPDDWLIWL